MVAQCVEDPDGFPASADLEINQTHIAHGLQHPPSGGNDNPSLVGIVLILLVGTALAVHRDAQSVTGRMVKVRATDSRVDVVSTVVVAHEKFETVGSKSTGPVGAMRN